MKNDFKRIDFVTVIVTYGTCDRLDGLEKTISSVIRSSTKKIVLIDNGCTYNLNHKIGKKFPNYNIVIKKFSDNQGSLVGFKTGLEIVLADGSVLDNDYILVLDDDVILDNNFLDEFNSIQKKRSSSNCIWSLYRKDRDKMSRVLLDKKKSFYENSAAGFSVFRSKKNDYLPKNENISSPFFIPWAGTFLKKSVLSRIPLPRDDFFVYEDDAEFSLNARDNGIDIFQCDKLILHESSESWFEKGDKKESGYKLYYSGQAKPGRFLYKVRNNIYFVKNRLMTSQFKFSINIFIFVIAGYLRYGLLKRGSIKRLKNLCNAILLGLQGKLGENKNWEL